jgi:hypothetical protein
MKIGMILKQQAFTVRTSFGIRRQSQNPLEIQIIDSKILILK